MFIIHLCYAYRKVVIPLLFFFWCRARIRLPTNGVMAISMIRSACDAIGFFNNQKIVFHCAVIRKVETQKMCHYVAPRVLQSQTNDATAKHFNFLATHSVMSSNERKLLIKVTPPLKTTGNEERYATMSV